MGNFCCCCFILFVHVFVLTWQYICFVSFNWFYALDFNYCLTFSFFGNDSWWSRCTVSKTEKTDKQSKLSDPDTDLIVLLVFCVYVGFQNWFHFQVSVWDLHWECSYFWENLHNFKNCFLTFFDYEHNFISTFVLTLILLY